MRAKVKVIDTTCAFSAADGPTDGGGGATRERGSENVKVASSCAPKRDGGESVAAAEIRDGEGKIDSLQSFYLRSIG